MPLFTLTPYFSKLSMQPESSNGFASVGTVLPKKRPPCCRAASLLNIFLKMSSSPISKQISQKPFPPLHSVVLPTCSRSVLPDEPAGAVSLWMYAKPQTQAPFFLKKNGTSMRHPLHRNSETALRAGRALRAAYRGRMGCSSGMGPSVGRHELSLPTKRTTQIGQGV